jgi:hypothetical protein
MISRFVSADNDKSQLVHRKEEGANGISSTNANVEEIGINDSDGKLSFTATQARPIHILLIKYSYLKNHRTFLYKQSLLSLLVVMLI